MVRVFLFVYFPLPQLHSFIHSHHTTNCPIFAFLYIHQYVIIHWSCLVQQLQSPAQFRRFWHLQIRETQKVMLNSPEETQSRYFFGLLGLICNRTV